mmetsp:Transcript_25330/g.36048  ORF Transcript_25330/g.36048 Transcript_25330/m.36048 type:complete len:135 (+) Transcript_25330:220-624(+)
MLPTPSPLLPLLSLSEMANVDVVPLSDSHSRHACPWSLFKERGEKYCPDVQLASVTAWCLETSIEVKAALAPADPDIQATAIHTQQFFYGRRWYPHMGLLAIAGLVRAEMAVRIQWICACAIQRQYILLLCLLL